MMTRIRLWLDALRTSLWFVPGLIVLGAVVMAYALLALDGWLPGEWWQSIPWLDRLLDVGVDGARVMLQVIGGSMMTVVGVVFSITIAALTLASNQYTSRVLRNFIRDRANQAVLGSFLGIFIYCLLVMRSLSGLHVGSHAPPVALLMALVLAFTAVALLIFFIHHMAMGLQVSHIVVSIAHESLRAVDRHCLDSGDAQARAGAVDVAQSQGTGHPVYADDSGYVVGVDHEALMDIATRAEGHVRVIRGNGDFVTRGERIAELHTPVEDVEDAQAALADAWAYGHQRTLENDPGFGMRQLVDVAMKALSPAVNETTTGLMCVNWLGVILERLVRCRLPPRVQVRDEQVRLIADYPSMADFLALGFDQIRQNAVGNVAILKRQMEVLELLVRADSEQLYRLPLAHQVDAVVAQMEASVAWPPDLEPLRDQTERLRQLLAPRRRAALVPD